MRYKKVDKNFNPFYDSKFLISNEDGGYENRLLVELYEDDLTQLMKEIKSVIKIRGNFHPIREELDGQLELPLNSENIEHFSQ